MAPLRIRKVKARVEKGAGKNSMKFASLNSFLPGARDTLTGTVPNDTSPPLDASLWAFTSPSLAASKKVASSSQGDDQPDLKDTVTSAEDAMKRSCQKIEAAGNAMELDSILMKNQAAKEERYDVDELGTPLTSKSREHSEIQKADSSGLGVGSEIPAEGPLNLEGLNKRSVSTTKNYVCKRRQWGRRAIRRCRRNQI